MKISKVLLAVAAFSMILLSACETTPSSSSQSSLGPYTLSFNSNGGSQVSPVVYDAGEEASAPEVPTKTSYMFSGWYFDGSFATPVPWPFAVTASMTLYAKWTELRTYFLSTRDATVNSNQFEYDFDLTVSTQIDEVEGPSGHVVGNAKYNSLATPSYLVSETCSGLVFGDVQVIRVENGAMLDTYKVNSENKIWNYQQVEIETSLRYDRSTFAQSLFAFTSDQITAVNEVGSGRYQLEFSDTFTGLVEEAVDVLDYPYVNYLYDDWGRLPTQDLTLTSNVTFAHGLIQTFSYEFSFQVSMETVTFQYELNFSHVGSGVSITAPSFSGLSIIPSETQDRMNEITANLTTYRNLAYSGYDYRVDTALTYPGKQPINSTTQGRTMRHISDGVNYFWNRVKFESDYKNADLYSNKGIVDYERYRVKYANKDIYDVEARALPLSPIYSKVDTHDYTPTDDFYMLMPNDFFALDNFSAIQTATDGAVKTYSMSINTNGLVGFLIYIDFCIRADLSGNFEFNILREFFDLAPVNSKFDVVFTDNALTFMCVDIDGYYNGTYYGAGAIYSGALDFHIKLEITTNDRGNNYVIPAQDSEVDLTND